MFAGGVSFESRQKENGEIRGDCGWMWKRAREDIKCQKSGRTERSRLKLLTGLVGEQRRMRNEESWVDKE